MPRKFLVLAALSCGLASGAAPAYSTDTILNGANFVSGPFAPNSILSIFGTELAYGDPAAADTSGSYLPKELDYVRVYVNNMPAPLLYVSPKQINLLIPSDLRPGNVPIRVVRQGVTGPEVNVKLMSAAPQIFAWPDGSIIAQHGEDYSLITADSPALPNTYIVVYATGLGNTQPNPAPGEIPQYPGRINGSLQLFLNGNPLSPDRILYAGLTPGSAGIYQINIKLPDTVDENPEITISLQGQVSESGLKLLTQPLPQ